MIPTAEQVARGYEFFARRYDLDPTCSMKHIEEALALARRLAKSPDDEPAAIFFAFISVRVAFPGALLAVTWQLSVNCAHAHGKRIGAARKEAVGMVGAMGRAEMDWTDVSRWFRARLVAIS